MPDQKMNVTNRRSYEFTKRDFGDAVYVEVLEEKFNVTMVGTGNDPVVRRSGVIQKRWGVCVARQTCQRHGGLNDPAWVLHADEDEEYIAVTQGYMDAYKEDQHHAWCYEKRPMKQDVLGTLQSGQLHLIVRGTSESVLYDLKGDPIPRRMFVDYIFGSIRGGRYYMKKVTDHLKAHPQCFEVSREGIPSYNAEFRGETAVEFYYEPKDFTEFSELINCKNSFERMQSILELLEVEQFVRNKKKREPEED